MAKGIYKRKSLPQRECCMCGKSEKYMTLTDKGYMCHRHYNYYIKNGLVKEHTRFDTNEFEPIDENTYKMYLYGRASERTGFVLVDKEDVERIKPYKWASKNYPRAIVNGKDISLHRFLVNADNKDVVDHINGNILDCRKANLRICQKYQNNINKSMQSNNTSGITGVSFDKCGNRWRANISVNSKNIRLGSFANKEDAIKARREAEIKYFGEFAPTVSRCNNN